MHTLPQQNSNSIFSICGINPAASYVEMPDCVSAVDCSARPVPDAVLLAFCGQRCYARLCGDALITDDGEAIEGDALDDVQFIGVVTHRITPAAFDGGVI